MADGDGRYMLNLAEEVAALKMIKPLDSAALDRGRCSAARRSTTRAARSITTSSPRSTNRSAAPIRTRRSTGWRACWPAASSRSTSPGGWCAPRRGYRPRRSAGGACRRWRRKTSIDFLGSPEGETRAGATVLYLASAPKSNAVYKALGAARRAAQEHGSLMPPAHILNAPTKLMKNLGYGAAIEYDHDAETRSPGQNYFPDAMARQKLYSPRKPASNARSPSGWNTGRSCGTGRSGRNSESSGTADILSAS